MDRMTICRNARLVLTTLGNNREWSYQELKQATGLADRDLNAAIGWLAHDGSICFGRYCGENRVSLGYNVYI
ncbi:MAG: winged helix-turn-helix domain-containing protein [Bacteroidaceae bacterium]|nr:winged helix-turn-helix domain-containing protein [Bacteroidaceae bacterium]